MFHRHQRCKKHNRKLCIVFSVTKFANQLFNFLRLNLCRVKITTISIFWTSIYDTTIMRSLNVCKSSTVTSEVFDTLFNCIRFDVSIWWIDRWEFISAFVCAASIMNARKLIFFFELHHRRLTNLMYWIKTHQTNASTFDRIFKRQFYVRLINCHFHFLLFFLRQFDNSELNDQINISSSIR